MIQQFTHVLVARGYVNTQNVWAKDPADAREKAERMLKNAGLYDGEIIKSPTHGEFRVDQTFVLVGESIFVGDEEFDPRKDFLPNGSVYHAVVSALADRLDKPFNEVYNQLANVYTERDYFDDNAIGELIDDLQNEYEALQAETVDYEFESTRDSDIKIVVPAGSIEEARDRLRDALEAHKPSAGIASAFVVAEYGEVEADPGPQEVEPGVFRTDIHGCKREGDTYHVMMQGRLEVWTPVFYDQGRGGYVAKVDEKTYLISDSQMGEILTRE